MLKARVSAPARARAGEIMTVKTLVSHPMETGFRVNAQGVPIPRNILTEFACLYNERLVFRAEFHPAVAANPFLSFHVRADESGVLTFRWRDQHGEITTMTRDITVDA